MGQGLAAAVEVDASEAVRFMNGLDPSHATTPPPSSPPEQLTGYRVLAVQPGSPCASLGLVPFFDHIVAIDGRRVTSRDPSALERAVRNTLDGQFDGAAVGASSVRSPRIRLTVYNAKVRGSRDIRPLPRRDWGGAGALGLMVQRPHVVDTSDACGSRVVRIVGVTPRSAASKAGLEAFEDYFLGVESTSIGAEEGGAGTDEPHPNANGFADVDEFLDVCRAVGERVASETSADATQRLNLFVYNAPRDSVRVATLRFGPSEVKHGLGLEVAAGLLHCIPAKNLHTLGKDESSGAESAAPSALQTGAHSRVFTGRAKVRTPEGPGVVVEELEENALVRLDWGDACGAQVVALVLKSKLAAA